VRWLLTTVDRVISCHIQQSCSHDALLRRGQVQVYD